MCAEKDDGVCGGKPLDAGQVPHLGLRTAVKFTINSVPPLSAPSSIVPIKSHAPGIGYASAFKSSFVLFNSRGGVRARVHNLKHPEEHVDEIFELRNGHILFSTPLGINNNIVAALETDQTLHTWYVGQPSPARFVGSLNVSYGNPTSMTALMGPGLIVIGYTCGALRIIEHKNGSKMKVIQTIQHAHISRINSLSSHGDTLLVAGEDCVASVWKWSATYHTLRCVTRLEHIEEVASVDMNGCHLVTATCKEIRVYKNVPGYRALKVFRCSSRQNSFPPPRMSLKLLSAEYLLVCGGQSLAFLSLHAGCVTARIATSLSAPKNFHVLEDARVLVSSEQEGEDLSIVTIDAPRQAHRALVAYSNHRFRRNAKLRRAILMVSAVASLIAAGKNASH